MFLQGEVQALFLRHEGYLGTIGAFLKGAEEDSESRCFHLWGFFLTESGTGIHTLSHPRFCKDFLLDGKFFLLSNSLMFFTCSRS